jgi:hypothetical protein
MASVVDIGEQLSPVTLTPVNNLSPVHSFAEKKNRPLSLIQSIAAFAGEQSIMGVIDTDKQFIIGVICTGQK